MINKFNQLDLGKKYTYADYLSWQFDDVVELIKGKVFKMSPAPGKKHQDVSSNLLRSIFQQLTKDHCKVYHAPFDVRLTLPESQQKDEKIDTVVQPDICVICDLEKLDNRGCKGAPDWIIEILSPATSRKDLTEKFEIYQNAGVKVYWIVHPNDETLLIYQLINDKYILLNQKPFTKGDKAPFGVNKEMVIDLNDIFD